MQSIPSEFIEIDRRKRVSMPYVGMSYRSPTERVLDFYEATIPFDETRAKFEASRCIHCPDPAPCTIACPVDNDIPSAMWMIEHGKFELAYLLYRKTTSLPNVCGRVCPHEELCEGSCVLNKKGTPVLTGALEAFVADYTRKKWMEEGRKITIPTSNDRRVAVVGAGPAGLGCADILSMRGYQVTVFDAKPAPGGLLVYGIPNFKLPKDVVNSIIQDMKDMGIKFIGNTIIGKDKTVDDLFEDGFEAVFIGVGAGVDATMGIPGEDLPGVYKGSEFLILTNTKPEFLPEGIDKDFKISRKVIIIGGGDTASDCLRTGVRMDTDQVLCVYRRTENEMPGSKKDRELTKEEGAEYQFLTQPVRFIADEEGRLAAIECVRNKLGEPDEKGRRRPVAIEGTNFIIETDMAVLAIGYWPDQIIGKTTPEIEIKKWGEIIVDPETGATTKAGVYAGGDTVTGPDLVVTAMEAGRRAALSIDAFLQKKKV